MDAAVVKVKIRSESGVLPSYETDGAAGMDIRAYIAEEIVLQQGERALVGTGLYMEIPPGYEAQIRARSGLAVKHGIGLVNGIGTIDSDYRGEIKVALINLGKETFTIRNGERIAQIVIAPFVRAVLIQTEDLSKTTRNEGGFGHTGV